VWTPCTIDDCVGEPIWNHPKCLQHADEDKGHDYLASVSRGIRRLSLRGTYISQQMWERISAALTAASERGHPLQIALDGAEISANLDFRELTFDYFEIIGAVVDGGLRLSKCVVKQRFDARFVSFTAPPAFVKTQFLGTVDLSCARAGDTFQIGFLECPMESFVAAGMTAKLGMDKCQCNGPFTLSNATANHLCLTDCTIEGELNLSGAKLTYFRAPRLRASGIQDVFGPVTIENDCDLSYARFHERVVMTIKARELRLTNAEFSAGGWIAAEGAIYLDGFTSGGPLQIRGPVDRPRDAQIKTMQGADAGNITFAHVDMRTCVLSSAHNLSTVRLEGTVEFLRSPWPTTRRRCIADEFAWRATTNRVRSRRWKRTDIPRVILRTSEIAAVYRSLRHAYETRSDQPGAADFYYGEMEMRRNTVDAGIAERIIVSVYWLISRYALRAWRVCTSIALVLVSGGYAMARWGFASPMSFRSGFMQFMRSAVPGLRPTYHDGMIAPVGWVLQIASIVLLPLLLALLLLALRNRVRR
jgi:hypothetical protein